MRRPRRPSIWRALLEVPLQLVFGIGIFLIKAIIYVRSLLPASLILILCAVLPLLGISLRGIEGAGSWLMVAAALMLAFAAGSVRSKR